jgi:hypothetical protein
MEKVDVYFHHKDPKKTFFGSCVQIPRIGDIIRCNIFADYCHVKYVEFNFSNRDKSELVENCYHEPCITIIIEDVEE